MINPFFNPEEQRLRAFFRILLFLFLFEIARLLPLAVSIVWLRYVIISALVFSLYNFAIRFIDLRPGRESGLNINKQWLHEFFAGTAIAACVMSLIFITEWLSEDIEITGFSWQQNSDQYWVFLIWGYFVRMLSVGFYEEIMARGYLLKNIADGLTVGKITPKSATILAVFISSAIFGLAHAANPNVTAFAIINIIMAGFLLAIPFVITGRLALSIGLHFAWNFFQGGIFGFPVSGQKSGTSIIQIQQSGVEWWTGGLFGPEGGLIGVLGILLILLISVMYLKWEGIEINIAPLFQKKQANQILAKK